MPRDVNGMYTLPAGNPVMTNTTISSTWANSTLTDIANAMTNSLDRSGASSGMTGQFKATDGSVGSPGISFTSEVTSGFYRAGLNDIRWAINGQDVLSFSGLRLQPKDSILAGDGTTAAPGYSFNNEPSSGWYRAGAGDVRLSITNSDVLKVLVAGITVPTVTVNGTTVPAAGVYSPAGGAVSLAAGAAGRLVINSAGNVVIQPAVSGTTLTVVSAGTLQTLSLQNSTAGSGQITMFNVGNLTDADFNIFISQVGAASKFALLAPTVAIPLRLGTNGALPAVPDNNNNYFRPGYLTTPINAQTGAYTLVSSDSGKTIKLGASTSGPITVPSGVFGPGDVVTLSAFFGTTVFSIIQGSGLSLYWAGNGTTMGNRSLTSVGIATIFFIDNANAIIAGTGLS